MTIELVRNQIKKFLQSDTAEVLAIRGAWGVGKTFAWNKYLLDASSCQEVALKHYSYVSLFGVTSLESLKFSMFENIVDVDSVGHKPSIETFRKSTEAMSKSLGRKSIRMIQGLPYVKNVSLALEAVSFLSLSKSIICIDDLERKGHGLNVKDVLGLVSHLKEQKDCKVVLILNDEVFDDEEGNDLETYREKVVDMELLFSPTPEECAQIAIPKEIPCSDTLLELSVKLKINNIRIIKKIIDMSEKLIPMLEEFEDEVLYQALHSLALFSLCFFSKKSPEVPDFEYVNKIGYKLWGLGGEDETEEQKKWNSFLRSYEFRDTDEFDLEISSSVERGFFDDDSLVAKARDLNDKVVASKAENSFSKAWDKYHDTFESNEEDLVESLYESFKENTKYISPINLNGTVKLFRDLGLDEKANELIEIYIEEFKDNRSVFNLDGYAFSSDIDDEVVRRRFNEESVDDADARSLQEVVDGLVGRNGWNRSDIDVLAKASSDDFLQLFRETKGRELSRYVDVCLQFERIGNINDRERQISIKARDALVVIGRESSLNARRVAKFGVDVGGDAD